MRGLAIGLALFLVACAGDDDDDLEDGAPPVDGGLNDGAPYQDAAPCTTALYTPDFPVYAGDTVEASVETGGFGLIHWTVETPNEGAYQPDGGVFNGTAISFVADRAGSWEIRVRVDDCGDRESSLVYVEQKGAKLGHFRLHYTPLPELKLPAQSSIEIPVLGGGAYEYPIDLVLGSGQNLDDVLALDDGSGAQPLDAQISLQAADGPRLLLYSDTEGKYKGTIERRDYQVTVVPFDESLASARLSLHADALAGGFTIDRGQAVEGTVLGAGGAPAVGALVAISVADLPAAFDTTDVDGHFSSWARDLGPLEIRVRPLNTDLPDLVADESFGLSTSGGPLTISLPAPTPVTAELKITSAGGTPLDGASVTFVGEGNLGTMGQGGVNKPARHASRRHALSGSNGALTLSLPGGKYQVIVEPPAGVAEAMAVQSLDFSTPPGGPVVLKTGAPSATKITVVDSAGTPVVGAKVLAVSRGFAGVGAGVAVNGVPIDELSNQFALGLVTGLAYDVIVVPPPMMGLLRRHVSLPSAGNTTVQVILPKALQLRGRVVTPLAKPARGVRVTVTCNDCETPGVELDETATTPNGEFRLDVPDPGVSP